MIKNKKAKKGNMGLMLVIIIVIVVAGYFLFFSDNAVIPINSNPCSESWTCGDWSTCSSNHQSRNCVDENSCGTVKTKPLTSKSCVIQNPSCIPNWQTGEWSTCSDGQQTRNVNDLNNCGTTSDKPSTIQSCDSPTGFSVGSGCIADIHESNIMGYSHSNCIVNLNGINYKSWGQAGSVSDCTDGQNYGGTTAEGFSVRYSDNLLYICDHQSKQVTFNRI